MFWVLSLALSQLFWGKLEASLETILFWERIFLKYTGYLSIENIIFHIIIHIYLQYTLSHNF